MTNLIDTNQDGKMTIGEYQDFSTKQQSTIGDKEAQLDMGLKALDLNHNGNLDRNEVPGNLDANAWNALLANGDKDKNGKLSLYEFKQMSQQMSDKEPAPSSSASSLTVTTVVLGLAVTMWLFG